MSEIISKKEMIQKISEYLFKYGGHNIDPREIWMSSTKDNIVFIYNQITFYELQSPQTIYDPKIILKKLFPNGYSFDKEGNEDRLTIKPYGTTWTGNHVCPVCEKKITTGQSTIVRQTKLSKINKPANHEFSPHISLGPNDLIHKKCGINEEVEKIIDSLPKYYSLDSLIDDGYLIKKDNTYTVQKGFAIPHNTSITFDENLRIPSGYSVYFNNNPLKNKVNIFKLK